MSDGRARVNRVRRPVHLRFIGGTVYCGHAKRRVQTGQKYGKPFVCPLCGFHWPKDLAAR